MTTENAKKIVDFLDFLNNWPTSHAFVIKVEEDEIHGTTVTVKSKKIYYRHQLNALMAVLDTMTELVCIYRVSEDGLESWVLW